MIEVQWIGGPHDGLHQKVTSELPRARVCTCHGALYLADLTEHGWELTYADHWTPAHREVAETRA